MKRKGIKAKTMTQMPAHTVLYTEKSTCAGWPVYRMDVGMSSSKRHRGRFEPKHAGPGIVR